MGIVVHVPPAPLRHYVAAAYGYVVAPLPGGIHRGLPSRHLTLVIDLGAPLTVSGLGQRVSAQGIVSGLHTRPAVIDSSRPQEGLQYALTPAAAKVLLGVSAPELQGRAVDLVDVLGMRGTVLLDALQGAVAWGERFRLLDEALLRGLSVAGPDATDLPAEVREAWRLLFSRDGVPRVGEVAARVGWSRRHLTEKFRLMTGLTPVEAIRIGRFESSRAALMDARPSSLAAVAAQCGYADQSHMAREWRSLAGCSLGMWLREELPFLQDSSLPDAADSLT